MITTTDVLVVILLAGFGCFVLGWLLSDLHSFNKQIDEQRKKIDEEMMECRIYNKAVKELSEKLRQEIAKGKV
jgi:peptidoglycan hydrolase CwlO-like protein